MQSKATEVLHSSWKEAAVESVLLHLFLFWNKLGDFDKTQLMGYFKMGEINIKIAVQRKVFLMHLTLPEVVDIVL